MSPINELAALILAVIRGWAIGMVLMPIVLIAMKALIRSFEALGTRLNAWGVPSPDGRGWAAMPTSVPGPLMPRTLAEGCPTFMALWQRISTR